ncbi:MAG: hypothetical protein ACOC4F_03175 [bacterium]
MVEYCVRELLTHTPAALGVAVLHNKQKEKRGVLPDGTAGYWAGETIPDVWVRYPWDADDMSEHERQVRLKRSSVGQ